MRQIAALPYRQDSTGQVQVLLVTSRKGKRWLPPKGNLMPGLPPHEAAAREAYEEAGVVGVVNEAAIGRYHARKIDDQGRSRRLEITLYSLAFERQAETWPEKRERQVQWFSPREAAAIVKEPLLGKLIVEWSETIRRSPTSPA